MRIKQIYAICIIRCEIEFLLSKELAKQNSNKQLAALSTWIRISCDLDPTSQQTLNPRYKEQLML
jgi:hypothetical protein